MRGYKIITEVPDEYTGKRKLVLEWMLKHADKVEIDKRGGGASMYRFHFDDGVYKGIFCFEINHKALTPLNAYLIAQKTKWPGLSLKWLEDIAEEEMQRELLPTPPKKEKDDERA